MSELEDSCPDCGYPLFTDGDLPTCYRCSAQEWKVMYEDSRKRLDAESKAIFENARITAELAAQSAEIERYKSLLDEIDRMQIDNYVYDRHGDGVSVQNIITKEWLPETYDSILEAVIALKENK